MTLTLGHGPLAGDPAPGNYRIDGPAHRIHFEAHPRRIRAELGGRTVLDTTRGALLHETGLMPVLYAPLEDYDAALLRRTDHTTHCPFKGDASYWSVGGAENVMWAYEDPLPEASWLRGLAALHHRKMDRWLEEDEAVSGPHLRDPYHRVDARRTSRPVEVRLDGSVIARSDRAVMLFETGLAPRPYLPPDGFDLLPSERRSSCPYKGEGAYASLRVGDRLLEDAAWTYPAPLEGASALTGLVAFEHEAIEVVVGPPGDG